MKVQEGIIPHVIKTSGTSMIESGINGMYRGNDLVGVMRGINPLYLLSLV